MVLEHVGEVFAPDLEYGLVHVDGLVLDSYSEVAALLVIEGVLETLGDGGALLAAHGYRLPHHARVGAAGKHFVQRRERRQ